LGGKLQPRIKTETLGEKKKADGGENQKQAENKENGRLLNAAIIKYRIEKKDILDSAYRSQFSQYSATGAQAAPSLIS
jgi:hypothetical protein